MSWFNPDPYSKIVRFIVDVTEPALKPIRNILPYMGSIDLSPVVALIILYFLKSFVVATVFDIGIRMH